MGQSHTQRNSSIELLRIFAAFIIILNHYALFGGFDLSTPTAFSTILPQWFHMGGKLGVDIFVLISGYFLCQSKGFKLTKLVKLVLEVLFYSILLLIIGLLCNRINFINSIRLLFAVPSGYWQFITIYVMMFLLSPFLNQFLRNASLQSLLMLVVLLTFTWVLFPAITMSIGIKLNFDLTYSLSWFLYLYLLAALIRRIEPKIPHHPALYLWIGFGAIALIAISEVVIGFAGVYVHHFFQGNEEVYRNYNSILIVISSVFLFLGFKQWNCGYKPIVNTIASTSLAVFMLHDNPVIRSFIWNNLFRCASYQHSPLLPFHAIGTCVIIFAVFCLVDLMRQAWLEKPLMNLLTPKIERLQIQLRQFFHRLSEKLQ